MKRTLLASLAAALFAAPAAAGTFAFELELPAVDELAPLHHELLAAADEVRVETRVATQAAHKFAEDFTHDLATGLTTMYGPRMSGSRVVKGAPYSAEVITETNQALADGNVITHKTTGSVYRDSEGRTRQESAPGGKREGTVYITDPVDSKHIVLLPGSKRALVTTRAPHENVRERRVMKLGSTEVRVEDGKVFIDGKEVTGGKVELNAGGKEIRVDNGRVTIDGKEIAAGHPKVHVRTVDSGDGTRREEVRVQVIRAGDKDVTIALPPTPPVPPVPPGVAAPMPPIPLMPGVQSFRFESVGRLGKGVTTSLGMKDFDGVRAEGKSTVWTIPAGQIGNRNAIQVTKETWYSPDLQVTVYSRYNDPRTGESVYRLAAIRRAEPPRDLFTVPEGYDTKGRGKREERK